MTTPKERPIILSSPMIERTQARTQARTKTQTRRVMKEPWKIRLPLTVRGDWPFQGTWATPGIYEAHHDRYGAVSVKALEALVPPKEIKADGTSENNEDGGSDDIAF